MKKVSIIFICHNSPDISLSLKSAINNIMEKDEIIVVDDNSDKSFHDSLKIFCINNKIKLLTSEKKSGNRAHNRNLGAKYSKNDLLLFLDGDVVIPDGFLDSFRQEFFAKNADMATCFVRAMGYTPEQLKLFFDTNLISLIKKKEFSEIENKYWLKDCRENRPYTDYSSRYSWRFIYSTCICIKKDIFNKACGFDENIVGWGNEDVDFAYRVSKIGNIEFIKNYYVWHLPHSRDRYKNNMENTHNFYYIIKKYPGAIEWEIYLKFSNLPEIMESLAILKHNLKDIEYSLPHIKKKKKLYFDTMSGKNGYGKITYYSALQTKTFESLGLAIPLTTNFIDTTILPQYIFSYPTKLVGPILQELYRVSKEVLILKIKDFKPPHRNKNFEERFKPRGNLFMPITTNLQDIIFEDSHNFIKVKMTSPKLELKYIEGYYYD